MGPIVPLFFEREPLEPGNGYVFESARDGIEPRRQGDHVRFVDGPVRGDDAVGDYMRHGGALHVHERDVWLIHLFIVVLLERRPLAGKGMRRRGGREDLGFPGIRHARVGLASPQVVELVVARPVHQDVDVRGEDVECITSGSVKVIM